MNTNKFLWAFLYAHKKIVFLLSKEECSIVDCVDYAGI
jgi:hypothetical protein